MRQLQNGEVSAMEMHDISQDILNGLLLRAEGGEVRNGSAELRGSDFGFTKVAVKQLYNKHLGYAQDACMFLET